MAYHKINKKATLLALKEEILRDIQYFDKRIEEARFQKTSPSYFVDDDDDSDSDEFLSLDLGPSIADLKLEQGRLQTCLQATQELTNLCILQSEVNIMVNDPVYEREPPVTEQGTWREVIADCKVDLVPFNITFYVHQASRVFGPTSYRGLRVSPVKVAHENELANSILPRVANPSDAVEVLRSYAVAHRSRRTTLARLAEKYSNSLFMEPMADGGYIIKCANLLEVIWTLENKWSPIAPFHHKMKFDLEYMDEMYVKIISQAHRELSDPTLETDERTRLLSKIIATCLEAQGPTQELYESMESDIESENRKRRSTLDEEIEEPVNKKKKDSEIMAPPKSLPKKTKPKGKENNADNRKDSKGPKRSVTDIGDEGAKKAKVSQGNSAKNSDVNTKSKVDKQLSASKKVTDNKPSKVKENNPDKTDANKDVLKSKEKIGSNPKNSNKEHTVKNIDAKSKNIDNEKVVTMKKGSDHKVSNVKTNVGGSKLNNAKNTDGITKDSTNKTNVDKDVVKSVNSNEKIVASSKNSVKDITGKNINAKVKNVDKENLTSKKVSDNKVGNVKNNVGNSKINNVKTTDGVATHSTDVLRNNKDSATGKRNINEKIAITESTNKLNNNKTNKNTDDASNQATAKGSNNLNNKNTQSNKLPKSAVKTNEAGKRMPNKGQNVEKSSQNNEKSQMAKVGNSEKNIGSKDDALKVVETVSHKNNNPKAKSTHSAKENIANIDDDLITGNTTNKKNVIKTKSSENIKMAKATDSNSGNLNTKTGEINIKSKSKEGLNDNKVKTKGIKNNKNENNEHVNKENTMNLALNNINVESNITKEKTVNKLNTTFTKTGPVDTDNKLVEKDINAKSKNRNKVLDKNEKIKMRQKNNDGNFNKLLDKHVASVKNKLQNYLNEEQYNKPNENTGRNLSEEKNGSNKETNSSDNVKNKTQNKNLRTSRSPKKNMLKILNPRNKISMNKPKVTDKQKENNLQNDNHNKNKILTKIPKTLITVRDNLLKKNPLRISPRKIKSNLKTESLRINSQNSSRSSQISIQKGMTGIPRLIKKPIRKDN